MLTARLIVHTQYRENYGAHDWSGEGDCPQYWKNKGGMDFLVAEVSIEEAMRGERYLAGIVSRARPSFEKADDFTEIYTLGWALYWPGELTRDERDEVEFDGALRYSIPEDVRKAS
jgi:hypothetical protein